MANCEKKKKPEKKRKINSGSPKTMLGSAQPPSRHPRLAASLAARGHACTLELQDGCKCQFPATVRLYPCLTLRLFVCCHRVAAACLLPLAAATGPGSGRRVLLGAGFSGGTLHPGNEAAEDPIEREAFWPYFTKPPPHPPFRRTSVEPRVSGGGVGGGVQNPE